MTMFHLQDCVQCPNSMNRKWGCAHILENVNKLNWARLYLLTSGSQADGDVTDVTSQKNNWMKHQELALLPYHTYTHTWHGTALWHTYMHFSSASKSINRNPWLHKQCSCHQNRRTLGVSFRWTCIFRRSWDSRFSIKSFTSSLTLNLSRRKAF